VPRRLAELGYRSRFDLYPGYEHFAFGLVDDWKRARAWLGNRSRERRPRVVTYRFSDGWTDAAIAAERGLYHESAWWVQGLTMREPTDDALVLASATAESWAIADDEVSVARPAPIVVAEPTPHTEQEVTWTDGAARPVANRLELDLTGVGTVTIDLDGAGLTACGLQLGLRSDGPATVRLLGEVRGRVDVNGLAVGARRESNEALVLTIGDAADGDAVVECRKPSSG
jgi:hypothetical protein